MTTPEILPVERPPLELPSTRLAVVVISHAKRLDLLDTVWQSLGRCDEPVVVGDTDPSAIPHTITYYQVPPITRTTLDALMKRDVGWIVTTADAVCFLSDDHRLDPDFLQVYREKYALDSSWDFLGPARYTERNGERIWLNNGATEKYVGGHGIIVRRRCAKVLPWMCAPHHPNWDLWYAQILQKKGYRLRHAEQDLAIEDIEPNAEPWK